MDEGDDDDDDDGDDEIQGSPPGSHPPSGHPASRVLSLGMLDCSSSFVSFLIAATRFVTSI